jgi:hypothetical protein
MIVIFYFDQLRGVIFSLFKQMLNCFPSPQLLCRPADSNSSKLQPASLVATKFPSHITKFDTNADNHGPVDGAFTFTQHLSGRAGEACELSNREKLFLKQSASHPSLSP